MKKAFLLAIIFMGSIHITCVAANSNDKIALRLNWKPGAEHIAYYVAKELGFYKKNNLDVDISIGSGSAEAVLLTAASKFDFALAAAPNIVQGNSRGMSLKVLAVIYRENPTCFTVLADSEIKTLNDLVGKKVGVQFDSSTFVEYLALLKHNNIDRSKIIEVPVSFGIEPLIYGRVDAFPGFLTQRPVQVEIAGKKPRTIDFKDYGINTYGVCIFTRYKYYLNNKEIVARFLTATRKGWEYVRNNPGKSTGIFLKIFKELSPEIISRELELLIPLVFTNRNELHNDFGVSIESRWADTIDVLYGQNIIKNKPDIDLLITPNSHVPY